MIAEHPKKILFCGDSKTDRFSRARRNGDDENHTERVSDMNDLTPKSPLRIPLWTLLAFLGVLALGVVAMVTGYFVGLHTLYSVGALFVGLGFFGAFVGGLVLVAVAIASSSNARTGAVATGPAPGWYPDAHDPHLVRYFDGRVWTPSTRPR